MKHIEFTKMHGLGNDYIYVDADRYPISDPSAFSIKWSKPHTGIGSDGLIMISRSDIADFKMRIFNNDGTEAKMCGNGSRCVGKFVYDKHLTDKTVITLDTLAGIKTISLQVEDGKAVGATVDMGIAKVESDGGDGIVVNMGNPHCVFFVDDITRVDVATLGKRLEYEVIAPERANIEFVQKLPDGTLRMRVWERGSGITMACGTGACATAVAALHVGVAGKESDVEMDGGTLHIRIDDTMRVFMTGPAETAFEGTLDEWNN